MIDDEMIHVRYYVRNYNYVFHSNTEHVVSHRSKNKPVKILGQSVRTLNGTNNMNAHMFMYICKWTFIHRADYSPILKNLSYSLSTRMPESKTAGTDGDKLAKVQSCSSTYAQDLNIWSFSWWSLPFP